MTEVEVDALGARGFFIRERFLGFEAASETAVEARAWHLQGRYLPANVRRAHARDEMIRNDETAWVTEGTFTKLRSGFEALRVELNTSAWLGLQGFEVQLAHYPPGARYVRHRDAFPGGDNRRVTAIVYLNPQWQPTDEGALRLHALPVLEVAPRLDTLVVFLSEQLEHEVLPTLAHRFAATAWFYARGEMGSLAAHA